MPKSEKPFKIGPYSSIDKWIEVTGPNQLSLRVDYDDVDQQTVRTALEAAVGLLNEHWKPIPDRVWDDDGETGCDIGSKQAEAAVKRLWKL